MIVKFFSNIGNSNEVASSTSLLRAANFCSLSNEPSDVNCLYFFTAANVTFPTEPFCLSHSFKAPSVSSLSNKDWILRTKAFTSPLPFAFPIVIRRSIEKVKAVKKQVINTGTITPPLKAIAR